jgi:chemotaxis signal transduction protein
MLRHLLFSVDRVRCAIPLENVRIVLQMVQLSPAPEERPGLAGSIDLHRHIVPVWSVRAFFAIPDRAPRLTDKLIVAQKDHQCAALWVDETHVVQLSPALPDPVANVRKGTPVVPGVTRIADGTYIFPDLFRYLADGAVPLPAAGQGSTGQHAEDQT